MSEEEHKGFKVRDRRRIAEDGELRSDPEAEAEKAPAAPVSAPRPERSAPAPERSSGARSVDFSALVLSVATNAAMSLSGQTDDDRIPAKVDLKGAAQHIDVLALLEEKTRGNLTEEETALLTDVLRDLRLSYIQVAQATPSAANPRG